MTAPNRMPASSRQSGHHPTAVAWSDVEFVPGLLYGDRSHDGDSSPGGVLNDRARRFEIREDLMSAPLFALSFRDGRWIALLDPAPHGALHGPKLRFPPPSRSSMSVFSTALGAREAPDGASIWLLVSGHDTRIHGRALRYPNPSGSRHRYHPINAGFSQSYQVEFRFGQNASSLGVERDAWRWAWQTLNPPLMYPDMDLVRRVLTDHLADHVLSADGRTGVPFLFDAVTGNPGSYRNWAQVSGFFPVPPPAPPNTPVTAHELSPEKAPS